MTDIVERLRKRREYEVMADGYIRVEYEDEDALEAADEIERLRAALEEELDAELKWAKIEAEQAHVMVTALQEKVERLRDALTRIARGFCTAEGMKAIADEALEGK